MTASPVQLTGGNFQDSEGNHLANGYLRMVLSQDGTVIGVGSICSGIEITIQLDANGSVVAYPAQVVWGNDAITPVNTYYKVTGYTAAGQPAWGPNVQQVVGGPTFDVGTWIPNSVISWLGVVLQAPILLETEGVPNASQIVFNAESTDSSIDITDRGAGNIDFQLPETTINNQSGSNYNAQLSDDGNLVVMSYSSGACTFTVLGATAFKVGAILTIIQAGTGQITLTPSGVTFQNPSSLTSRVQWSTISLTQIAAGVWVAAGDLT